MKKKENKNKADNKNVLPFGQYNVYFELLRNGNTHILRDKKSDQSTYMPVKITDNGTYLSEPDGKLIPQMQGQHKCDYLIYCEKKPQVCYIELKGKNISTKNGYNPYDQIIDTIKYLRTLNEYECLFSPDTENHAFIVSPGQQKIPKGIEMKERALWQELIKQQKKPTEGMSNIHYVKVTPSSKYSDNTQKIICSSASPIPIPYQVSI